MRTKKNLQQQRKKGDQTRQWQLFSLDIRNYRFSSLRSFAFYLVVYLKPFMYLFIKRSTFDATVDKIRFDWI